MMNSKISPNLISFIPVRRGDWVLKVSVFKHTQILVIAHSLYEPDHLVMKTFLDQNAAADFIEQLVIED